MKLDLYALNGRDVLLNPEESEVASDLEAKLAAGDREGAVSAWRDWVATSYGKPGRTRRTEAGKALGLTIDNTLIQEQARDAVRENLRKLGECIVHHFDTEQIKDWADAPEKFRCIHCDGSMSVLQSYAYASGWRDHGGDPEVVLPGFTR